MLIRFYFAATLHFLFKRAFKAREEDEREKKSPRGNETLNTNNASLR